MIELSIITIAIFHYECIFKLIVPSMHRMCTSSHSTVLVMHFYSLFNVIRSKEHNFSLLIWHLACIAYNGG